MASLLEGRCLCGGVTVRLPQGMSDVGVCHCETCRCWGSGPWMSLQAPGSVISGDMLIVYRASRFAERGFCRRCGTHIFHRPQDGPELAVSAGLFDATSLYVAYEIFHDAKPAFYQFVANSEKRSTTSMTLEWAPRLLFRRLLRAFGRKSSDQVK